MVRKCYNQQPICKEHKRKGEFAVSHGDNQLHFLPKTKHNSTFSDSVMDSCLFYENFFIAMYSNYLK